jgi:uncharacterized protein (DUF1499 family)
MQLPTSPNSVRSVDKHGVMPLHYFCNNVNVDETAGMDTLKLLIKKCPEAVRIADSEKDFLPIHVASMVAKSLDFFRVLIEAYPG